MALTEKFLSRICFWQCNDINTLRIYYTAFLVFFLATGIVFGINITCWLRQNYLYQTKDIEKCLDDLTGVSPYVIPQGQSILHYDSTVIINKNQPFSICNWVPEGYTSTPERDCPFDYQYVLTPVFPMSSSSILTNIINQVQKLIIDSSSNTSVIYFQSLSTIHCSIQYFSCYNYLEYLIMQQVFKNFKWHSFIVTFNEISCDVSTVGSYLLVEADLLSQKNLFYFVRELEKEINEQGVQIKIPRIEKFHLTLAGVTYTYPSNCVINKLKKELIPKLQHQQFGSVRICCFITKIGLNITYYYAQDCNKNDDCVFDMK